MASQNCWVSQSPFKYPVASLRGCYINNGVDSSHILCHIIHGGGVRELLANQVLLQSFCWFGWQWVLFDPKLHGGWKLNVQSLAQWRTPTGDVRKVVCFLKDHFFASNKPNPIQPSMFSAFSFINNELWSPCSLTSFLKNTSINRY